MKWATAHESCAHAKVHAHGAVSEQALTNRGMAPRPRLLSRKGMVVAPMCWWMVESRATTFP